jgi:hypothetical protein
MIKSSSRRFSFSKSPKELEVSTKTKSSEMDLLTDIGLEFLTTPDDAQPTRFNRKNKIAAKLNAHFMMLASR